MSINFNSLVTLKNKNIIPFLYQFEFYTCNHLLTFSVTTSSLSHLFPLMTSLRAPKRCNSEEARSGVCGVWARAVHLSFVIVSCVFKLVCRCGLSFWKRISAPFWWDRTLLKCFCKVLKVWMYRFELLVWPRGIMPTTCASQKNSGHDLPCWRGILKLLFPSCWMVPFHCLFVCSSKVLDHVSSPLTIRYRKLSPSAMQWESTSELSAQLYNGRLGFVEPNEHTLLHNLRHH